MAILLLLLLIPAIFGGLYYTTHHTEKKALASKAAPKPAALDSSNLSEVAAQVYREYMNLPVDSRPFGDNIKDILQSLDATLRHIPGFKFHFDGNYDMRNNMGYYGSYSSYDKFKFDWHADTIRRPGSRYHSACHHNNCAFKPYYDLHVEIENVKKALDEKRIAMVQSENAANVALADELLKALRQEAEANRQATTRLKEIG